MTPANQIFKSKKQTVLKDNATNEKTLKGQRTITIEDGGFTVELPDNTVLKGKLFYQSSNNGKDNYLTDKECPFAIGQDEIFLNLYRTHNAAYTFYRMTSEDETPNRKWWQKLFG